MDPPTNKRVCYEHLSEAARSFVQLAENGETKVWLTKTTYKDSLKNDQYEIVAEIINGELVCREPSIMEAIEQAREESHQTLKI